MVPHICILISTDYKVYDLCLTFSLQVSWGLGVDYMHCGSIRSYASCFRKSKHGYTE